MHSRTFEFTIQDTPPEDTGYSSDVEYPSHGSRRVRQNKQDKNFCQWRTDGRNFIPTKNVKLVKKVYPGVYKIQHNNNDGFYAVKQELSLDELLILPQPEQEMIITDITKFWNSEELFKKYKYAYKRGILLFGPPGNGKTSIINLLSARVVKDYSGVVFLLDTSEELKNFLAFISSYFRQIEPNTPILCVLEDLESVAEHAETLLLNTLDGASQVNNVVFIGCTNYPENLKERILNRPNRFDRRYYIGTPNAEVRRFYFEKKLKKEDLEMLGDDLNKWVEKTKSFSIAHLGEIIKSVFVLGHSFDETVETLEKMKIKLSSHNFEKETDAIGFVHSNNGTIK